MKLNLSNPEETKTMKTTAYGQKHLPGYLPEKEKKEVEEKTLARMKVPFSKIPFI